MVKAAYDLKEKEQTLHIYLTSSFSDINPFNNCRLKSLLNEVEVVVFDTPPLIEKADPMDHFCKLLQKNYNKETLLKINKALTKSLNDKKIDMTLIDQKMSEDFEKLSMGIALKVFVLMTKSLGLKQTISDSMNSKERMDPKQRIHQKAEETKKSIEYIDQKSFIEKNKELLFDKGFLEMVLCSVLTDQELIQDLVFNLKIEEESWNTSTLKEADYSKFEKHPTIVDLQQKVDGDSDQLFILAEKINHCFSSKKKTLVVIEEHPQAIQKLKTFISVLSLDSEVKIKGPLKEPTGCFWKIKKNDLTVGYLLGSLHLTPNYLLDLNSRIRKCFEKSNRLAVEMDITRQDIEKKGHGKVKKHWEEKYSSLTNDQIDNISTTLKKLFPDESGKINFNDKQEKSDFIINAILKLKSKIFSELELFSGIDLHLIQQAKRLDKPVEDLETLEQYKQQETTQTTAPRDPKTDMFLQVLSSEELKQFEEPSEVIKAFIEQVSFYYSENLRPLFDAWEEGNLAAFDDSKYSSSDDVMIMTQRNMNMAMKIVKLINAKEKIFCCVGAAHTVGEMNIQAFLKNFGFLIERVLI